MAFATLTLDLIARLANIEADMGRMAQLAEKGAQRVDRAFSAIGATVGGLGIGLGVAAITNGIRNIVDQADGMNDLASRTQTSVQAIASLKLISEQSGTSIEALGAGLNKLTKYMGENADEARQLGLTAQDPVEAFLQLADVLDKAATPQDKAVIASKVLGKSYADLLPLLNEGSEAIRRSVQASAAYAASMARLAPQADRFNDALASLKQAGDLLKITLGEKVVPGLTDVVKAMAQAAEESGTLMAAWVGLGGLGDNLLNGSQLSQAKARLASIEADLPRLRKALSSGTFTGGETGKGWLDAIIPDIRLNPEARANLETRIKALESEAAGLRERIQGSNSQSNKKGNTTADDLISEADANRMQSALRKAFDIKPLDDFIEGFQDKARKISETYTKLRIDLEPNAGGQATGLDVSTSLERARTAFGAGDVTSAGALLDKAKSQLRDAAGNGAPGFETAFLSKQLEAFELSMNQAAEKAAVSTRDVLRKNLEAVAESIAEIKPIHLPIATEAIADDLRRQLDEIRKDLAANPLQIPTTVIADDAANLRRAALKFGAR